MAELDPVVAVCQPGRRPVYLVVKEPIEVGRDCDGLLIADDQASRRHLELSATASGVVVTDLGSTNGTFIDGRRMSRPVLLSAGSMVRAGQTTIELVTSRSADSGTFDARATSIELIAEELDQRPADPAAIAHDHGTVTIVFSDIESSTSLSSTIGDAAWFTILKRHNEIVRRRLQEFSGTEVKNQGDGFMLTFPSARAAVRCMISMQRDMADWRTAEPDDGVWVRMGAHIGEAIATDDGDLFGRHVNVAARIASTAEGGQILVSSMVKELVASRGDIEFEPGISVQLKGFEQPETVHEVRW